MMLNTFPKKGMCSNILDCIININGNADAYTYSPINFYIIYPLLFILYDNKLDDMQRYALTCLAKYLDISFSSNL